MSATCNTPSSHDAEPADLSCSQQLAAWQEEEHQSDPERQAADDELSTVDFDSMLFDNDDCWDVFIPDDDEFDPLPEPGDFWIEPD